MSETNSIPPITQAKAVRPNYAENLRKVRTLITIPVRLDQKELIKEIAMDQDDNSPSTLEKIWLLVKKAPAIINLLFSIISISSKFKKGEAMTQSMLDTIKGIIRAIFAILAGVGLTSLTPEQVESIVLIFATAWGLVELILGFFSNSKMIKK